MPLVISEYRRPIFAHTRSPTLAAFDDRIISKLNHDKALLAAFIDIINIQRTAKMNNSRTAYSKKHLIEFCIGNVEFASRLNDSDDLLC